MSFEVEDFSPLEFRVVPVGAVSAAAAIDCGCFDRRWAGETALLRVAGGQKLPPKRHWLPAQPGAM